MLGPLLFGAAAVYSGLRTVWRPDRAVVSRGKVEACEGKNRYDACDPTLRIAAARGTPVYATAPGTVAAAQDGFVHIVARNEPVVVMYAGVASEVRDGQHVGAGQRIGVADGTVAFGVWALADGKLVAIPPSAWLAARGYRIATTYTGVGDKWCESVRDVSVPATAGKACGFTVPDRGAFALLPVSVSLER